MRNTYQFTSQWSAPAAVEAVWGATEQLLASNDPFPWWPSVRVVDNDGTSLRMEARSLFGYVLRFRLYDLVREPPGRLTFASDGDLAGHGAMQLTPVDAHSSLVDIDWNVRANPVWMTATSWLLRPLFVLGHHALMRQGEKNFNRWLAGTQTT